MSENKKLLLEVEDLVTNFHTEDGLVYALEDVNFSMNRGEVYSLVGETGCGKSVTTKSILGLLERAGSVENGSAKFHSPKVGELVGEGSEYVDLLSISDGQMRNIRGEEITLITQDPTTSLNPVYTVKNQLLEMIKLHKDVDDEEATEYAKNLLEEVNLVPPEDILEKYPFQLSGGQKQRIVIAMALSTDPSLIISDEPTTALDVTIEAKVLEMIRDLMDEHNSSMLLITHNLGVVAQVSDTIGIMYAGRVVEESTAQNIFHEPLHPYTLGLLEAVPNIEVKKEKLDFVDGSVPDLYNPPSGCRFHPRCPYATSKCKEEMPPYEEVETGHKVACYHYDEVIEERKEAEGI